MCRSLADTSLTIEGNKDERSLLCDKRTKTRFKASLISCSSFDDSFGIKSESLSLGASAMRTVEPKSKSLLVLSCDIFCVITYSPCRFSEILVNSLLKPFENVHR